MSEYLRKKIIVCIIPLFIISVITITNANSFSDEIIVKKFNLLYDQFKIKIETKKDFSFSSTIRPILELDEFKKIINLGPKTMPYIIITMKEEGNNLYSNCLLTAAKKISKFDISNKEKTHNDYCTVFHQTWEKYRLNSSKYFNILYSQWKELPKKQTFNKPFITNSYTDESKSMEEINKKIKQWQEMPEGEEKERLRPFAKSPYQNFLDMGIIALPHAIEKIQEGDEDLIEAVNYWTDDALKNSAEKAGVPREQMRQYCLQWWEQNKDDWLLPPVQEAPEP